MAGGLLSQPGYNNNYAFLSLIPFIFISFLLCRNICININYSNMLCQYGYLALSAVGQFSCPQDIENKELLLIIIFELNPSDFLYSMKLKEV